MGTEWHLSSHTRILIHTYVLQSTPAYSQGDGKRPERNPLDEIETLRAEEIQPQLYETHPLFVIDQRLLNL